jgi:hypothetical protein
LLAAIVRAEAGGDPGCDLLRHKLGLAAPAIVAHVIDIAIAAIEIAAAGDFEKDRVDGPD